MHHQCMHAVQQVTHNSRLALQNEETDADKMQERKAAMHSRMAQRVVAGPPEMLLKPHLHENQEGTSRKANMPGSQAEQGSAAYHCRQPLTPLKP